MALSNAYLQTTKNLESFLNSIQSAQAPERVTNKFLAQLDFSSSNDRLLIGVLKGLGFIDESGVPQKRYFEFLDQTQSQRVLAEAIREAYSDLFALNKNAQTMTVDEVKNKFRTLTLGQKSENVVSLMANTFKALTELADWESPSLEITPPATPPSVSTAQIPATVPPPPLVEKIPPVERTGSPLTLHYNVQIHLPDSRDPAVFDAIFQALRKHLG
jgi:Family of unknown function (DUF5343)